LKWIQKNKDLNIHMAKKNENSKSRNSHWKL